MRGLPHWGSAPLSHHDRWPRRARRWPTSPPTGSPALRCSRCPDRGGPMTHRSPRPPVLVGVDASAPGLGAAGWAARETQRRRTVLRAVHAFSVPTGAGVPAGRAGTDARAALRGAVEAAPRDPGGSRGGGGVRRADLDERGRVRATRGRRQPGAGRVSRAPRRVGCPRPRGTRGLPGRGRPGQPGLRRAGRRRRRSARPPPPCWWSSRGARSSSSGSADEACSPLACSGRCAMR
jgi:hypothetical protein